MDRSRTGVLVCAGFDQRRVIVPGGMSFELTEDQEVNYPAVMRTLLEVGFNGYVAQEFIPTWPDKVAALRHAVRVCDV